jgi:integrase/recombinase XerD
MPKVAWRHFPLVADYDYGHRWLQFIANLGRASNTVEAYGHALEDHVRFCAEVGADPLTVRADENAAWIGDLR